ncbi:MAG: adenine phosphoribosyltransferase [Candidatus Adiutrix sp.]|jgi:adenine phosphoribosyltransferase|nr:adenine phosphoribosyltransferase [Candidatus Adiutrix sp.]
MSIASYIRTIPDYPHPGILFRDITTLFLNPHGLRQAIDALAAHYAGAPVDKIAAIEARGFLVGAPLAYLLNVGFIPLRKKGKLPADTIEEEYQLEYGKSLIEMHKDAITPGERILLVDDLLATGGTAEAAMRLIARCGGLVHGAAFLVDLPELGGAAALRKAGHDVFTVCEFEGK